MNDSKELNNEENKIFYYNSFILILIITLVFIFAGDKIITFIIFYALIIISIIKRDKQDEKNELNEIMKNSIIGEICVKSKDINKKIQIMHSYENIKKINNYEKDNDDWKYENEKEIKENTIIKINGKKIKFQYVYKFEKEGIYQIEYYFKINLVNINHLFCNCKNFTKLDLSNFNSQNIFNMYCSFSNCISLTNLNLYIA